MDTVRRKWCISLWGIHRFERGTINGEFFKRHVFVGWEVWAVVVILLVFLGAVLRLFVRHYLF
jgi:hypothetical protein